MESMMSRTPIRKSHETPAARAGASGAAAPRAGFSILEVMIALSVLALGVLGMTAGQISAIKLSGDSRERTLAMYLAQQQVETIQAMTPTAVKDLAGAAGYPNDPDNPIDPNPADSTTMEFNRSWIVEEDTPEAGVITVTVAVAWEDNHGQNRVVRLRTLKADF
jgi:type IV pilus assembly protein PilV